MLVLLDPDARLKGLRTRAAQAGPRARSREDQGPDAGQRSQGSSQGERRHHLHRWGAAMTHPGPWNRKPEGRLKDFGLFHAKGVASIAQGLADGKLKRWDPTVLWLLLPDLKFPASNGDAPLEANYHPGGEPECGPSWREPLTPAGRIRVNLAELAAQIGQPREEVFRAVARLQAAGAAHVVGLIGQKHPALLQLPQPPRQGWHHRYQNRRPPTWACCRPSPARALPRCGARWPRRSAGGFRGGGRSRSSGGRWIGSGARSQRSVPSSPRRSAAPPKAIAWP